MEAWQGKQIFEHLFYDDSNFLHGNKFWKNNSYYGFP